MVNQSNQIFEEQREIVKIYDEQLNRWRREAPTSEQIAELDRLDGKVGEWGRVVAEILAVGEEWSKGAIEKGVAMSDLD